MCMVLTELRAGLDLLAASELQIKLGYTPEEVQVGYRAQPSSARHYFIGPLAGERLTVLWERDHNQPRKLVNVIQDNGFASYLFSNHWRFDIYQTSFLLPKRISLYRLPLNLERHLRTGAR